MLFERCPTKYRKRSIKQHITYFNFRSNIQSDHPVNCGDERRPDPEADQVLLIEGEGVQEGGQEGDRYDEDGVEVSLPRRLVAGHKVDEKTDNLWTGKLKDGYDDVEESCVRVRPSEGCCQSGQNGERPALGSRSFHFLLPAAIPGRNNARTPEMTKSFIGEDDTNQYQESRQ